MATVAIIGIQIINILKQVHQRAIVHNDIKPKNICWGKFSYSSLIEKESFFLIDFGYARKIGNLIKDNEKNNIENFKLVHYEDKYENKYEGTPKFMAIRVLEGFRPSRRTDIEELLYTLIFLVKKKLPWDNIKGKNHLDVCKKMFAIKKGIRLSELFNDLPNEFMYIYKNIIKLEFSEEPEYELYIILLNNILRRFNINDEEKQKVFIKEKINNLLGIKRIITTQEKKDNVTNIIFEGFPLNIIN